MGPPGVAALEEQAPPNAAVAPLATALTDFGGWLKVAQAGRAQVAETTRSRRAPPQPGLSQLLVWLENAGAAR